MVGIIIASHGPMAQGLFETTKLFFGDQENFEALCLAEDDNIDEFDAKLMDAITRVDTGDGVLLDVDLLFGSPCNVAIRHLEMPNLQVLTGLNLPLILHLLDMRTMGEIDLDEAIEVGRSGIGNLREILAERK